jgi:hypothetical protein
VTGPEEINKAYERDLDDLRLRSAYYDKCWQQVREKQPDVLTRLKADEIRYAKLLPVGSIWTRKGSRRGPFREVTMLAPMHVPTPMSKSTPWWEICMAVRFPKHVAEAWVLDVELFLRTNERVDTGKIDYDGVLVRERPTTMTFR